ncbi:MAG: 16S rRNA (guanine(527)-N(7))-methyltransferase RsmG [Bacteroidia bacterium]|nr:16S rRNA (guanine(527)-N(7))-methyltransferase RsmG [Bacteroidia bacterium]MDW8302152.1 16S rRNA (guanine(527)-N(7))-methyltransferase RsmG [Bacteroidia bacterium]
MIIKQYFELNELQVRQFEQFYQKITFWNEKINLVSRKDIPHLWTRHILHSAMIAKIISFAPNTKILDVGTGGGFPGIPLAILFPDCNFTLVDSITKKINAVQDIVQSLGLRNVKVQVIRAEHIQEKFDFVVSRAVAQLPQFYAWVYQKIDLNSKNTLKNGILYLKGGKIQNEVEQLALPVTVYSLAHFADDEFFSTKYLVHVPVVK